MNNVVLMTVVVLVAAVLDAGAQVPMALSSLKTVIGTEYQKVTITDAGPDGIKLVHANGLAKLAWREVPAEIRTRLGWTDERISAIAADNALVEKVKAAESAAAAARKRLALRKIKPLPMTFVITAEAGNGSLGQMDGKDAFLLGAVLLNPGTTLEMEGWRDGMTKVNGKSMMQVVMTKPVEIPAYKEAVTRLNDQTGGDAGMEVKIGAVETNQARERLRTRGLPTQVVQFTVTEVVYNGALGTATDGKPVYVVGAMGLKKDQAVTVTAWPDGRRTVGGTTFQVFVTSAP